MNDLSIINGTLDQIEKIKSQTHENRMKYELWIESSPSFLDFKNSLAKRGFTNTPITDKTFLGVPVSIKSNGVMKLPRQNIMMKRGGNN